MTSPSGGDPRATNPYPTDQPGVQPGYAAQASGAQQAPAAQQVPGGQQTAGAQPASAMTASESVWSGPASYWVSHPLGYATLGAGLGLALAIAMPFLTQSQGSSLAPLDIALIIIGVPGICGLVAAVFWIPTLIVSRLLGRAFGGLGDNGGKLLGLLAILLGGGLGYLIALPFDFEPMWGLLLGFFGTLLLMNLGQAIGRSMFFRRPGRVRVGLIVHGVLIVAAVVAQVVSAGQA